MLGFCCTVVRIKLGFVVLATGFTVVGLGRGLNIVVGGFVGFCVGLVDFTGLMVVVSEESTD